MTGNTVVDALQDVSRRTDDSVLSDIALADWLDTSAKLVLVTAHRRESFGFGLEQICHAIKRFAHLHGNGVQIVFPVHLNPQVQERVHSELSDIPNVRLTKPVDYRVMVALLRRCHFVLTDSGGIQEEAPTFGKPVLVMRDATERPEGIEAGIAKLVGVSAEQIITEASRLLESEEAYLAMAQIHSPYGDGRAADRIVKVVTQFLETSH